MSSATTSVSGYSLRASGLNVSRSREYITRDVKTEDHPDWPRFAAGLSQGPQSSAAVTYREATQATTYSTHEAANSVRKASAEWLKAYAHNRMRAIVASDPSKASAPAISAALMLLQRLVFDNGPTPQVADRGDGGFDIEWLVGNCSVNASCYSDGAAFIWAEDADGTDLFEQELSSVDAFKGDEYMQAVELLKAMGAGVRARVATIS